jgi:predicted RNA polymerase sigma factor
MVTCDVRRHSPVCYEAPSAETTDWPQIAALYDLLLRLDPNPVVALNHTVAVAMARGPEAGLELLALFGSDSRVNQDAASTPYEPTYWR